MWNILVAFFSGCTSHIAFGLASGMVPNERISASTTYNSSNNFNHYGASQARLGIASFWCGSDKATWKDDWIQVEFGDSEQITGIAVEKGWENNPHGILSEFYLQFSDDGITFKNQTGESGKSVVSVLPLIQFCEQGLIKMQLLFTKINIILLILDLR